MKETFLKYHECIKRLMQIELETVENGFEMCEAGCRHIYKGINDLAEALQVELIASTHSVSFPYRLSFTYDGIEYFQISETEVFR